MTDTKEIILKLKEAKKEKNLSINDIVELTGNYLSKTTVQRVFADGSENTSFRYDDTIRPLVKALLDVDTIEERYGKFKGFKKLYDAIDAFYE